jgi:hypothetical protein
LCGDHEQCLSYLWWTPSFVIYVLVICGEFLIFNLCVFLFYVILCVCLHSCAERRPCIWTFKKFGLHKLDCKSFSNITVKNLWSVSYFMEVYTSKSQSVPDITNVSDTGVSILRIRTFLKTFMEYEFGHDILCEWKSYMSLRMDFLVKFVEEKQLWSL